MNLEEFVVGGSTGVVNPAKPNVIFHPSGPRIDGPKSIRDNGPSNKLATTMVTPTLPKEGVTQRQKQTVIR
jgi:hypothetical protein